MIKKTVIIRCNASSFIGLGHVMRCLTLAEELHNHNVKCVFLTNDGGREAIQKFASVRHDIVERQPFVPDDEFILNAVSQTGAEYVVWDSYEMTQDSMDKVATNIALMVIDDVYLLSYDNCDAVLNQNLYAVSQKYKKNDHTAILAGSEYTLLRPQFIQFRSNFIRTHKILRLLLTFGGADEENLTCKILQWLTDMSLHIHIDVVVGPHYNYTKQLISLINDLNGREMTINYHQNVLNMAELLIKQDLVICAGGSTLYELAFLGIPSCCIVTAQNQLELANTAEFMGFSKSFGLIENLQKDQVIQMAGSLLNDKNTRNKMSKAGRRLIDGQGVKRVVSYICGRLGKTGEGRG